MASTWCRVASTRTQRTQTSKGVFKRTIDVNEHYEGYPNANLIYRRLALERVNGFDKAYWGAGEDADLAHRVIESGGGVVYADDALVWHAVRAVVVRRSHQVAAALGKHAAHDEAPPAAAAAGASPHLLEAVAHHRVARAVGLLLRRSTSVFWSCSCCRTSPGA